MASVLRGEWSQTGHQPNRGHSGGRGCQGDAFKVNSVPLVRLMTHFFGGGERVGFQVGTSGSVLFFGGRASGLCVVLRKSVHGDGAVCV